MASKFSKSDFQFTSALQSTVRLLGVKFSGGTGYMSVMGEQ